MNPYFNDESMMMIKVKGKVGNKKKIWYTIPSLDLLIDQIEASYCFYYSFFDYCSHCLSYFHLPLRRFSRKRYEFP